MENIFFSLESDCDIIL